ncbi:high-affinity branched-chain amino acid ABC transporter, permease protein [Candidatus Vecturithrix granuli]|uniref:High-affinity branched-chain amino acid ABC transporter, permease protein n=1 Tax=Vecturithrix granuli TaxID=1499967 RepID=A0A0S6W9Z9_VECG1|nr:high-affinity branched-chain amino acid ABC transporter, permease protein [Candidatus Vecturithrix granuli]
MPVLRTLGHALIRNAVIIGIIFVLLLLPLFLKNHYYLRILVLIGIYVILTSSLNLINGYTGLFSIGHAAFYGIGAYTSAILVRLAGWPVWSGMIFAALAAALSGYLIAKPTIRLTGIFLTLVTLGFNIIVMLILLNWTSLTRGPLGIAGIPAPSFQGKPFLTPTPYYYLILALDLLVLFCLSRLVHSRFGRALKAIREDVAAADICGVDPAYYKITAFVIAAGMAGIAGGFYSHYMRYVSPDAFTHLETFAILTMLAFGGPGNLLGPIVGSAILIILTEAFRVFADYRMIIYGSILIFMMLFRREGLLGGKEYSLVLNWPRKKSAEYSTGDKFLVTEDEND